MALVASMAFNVSAEVIKFSGSSYHLGKHVAFEQKNKILDAIDAFHQILQNMSPSIHIMAIAKGLEGEEAHKKLLKTNPDLALYLQCMSEVLNRNPNLLLAVSMSNKDILSFDQVQDKMVLNYTDIDGKQHVIETWGGLIQLNGESIFDGYFDVKSY